MYKDTNKVQFESLVPSEPVYFELDDMLESNVADKTCQNPQVEELQHRVLICLKIQFQLGDLVGHEMLIFLKTQL